MKYAASYPGTTAENMFVKTLIFGGVFCLDVLTLESGLISNTVGIPFEVYYLLVELVIQTNDTAKQRFFNQFGLSSTSYYYTNFDSTEW